MSFADFVLFYSTEYAWGSECVSVRTGKQHDISSYPNLRWVKPRAGVSEPEWKQSIRIEDPIETSRDLAGVLHAGHLTERLTCFDHNSSKSTNLNFSRLS